MLTRRQIRVKVMQSIYALHQEPNYNLQKEERFLEKSMQNTHTLYATLMSLLVELHDRSADLVEIAKTKYLTNTENNAANLAFFKNEALTLVANDEFLSSFIGQNAFIRWDLYPEFVDLLYKEIVKSEIFENYLKNTANFEKDAQFLVEIYSNIIATNEKLYDFLETEILTWADDIPVVNTAISQIFQQMKPKNARKFFVPKLYKNADDKNFGIELLQKSVLNDEKFHTYLEEVAENWDINRITPIDAILIKMGITEFLKFPSIPIKVTLNEYLEIAKDYSTPSSSTFINGILNKLSENFKEKNMIQKIGRGLL